MPKTGRQIKRSWVPTRLNACSAKSRSWPVWAAGDRRGERVTEQLWAGALGEVIGERRRAGGKTAGGSAERLAERGGDDVHVAQHAVVLGRAAAVLAEHAGSVRVVHGHDRPVLACQHDDVGELRNVALH